MSSRTQLREPPGNIPYAVRDPLRIPRQRYFDREFYELEKERLWLRTWQMACRLEEIPEPYDYVEYEICDQSILVVRQRDRSVRAYFNACRHRGTQLAKGVGRFAGGKVTCPYHGWTWKADGSCFHVHGERDFTPELLDPDDLRLRECKAEIWAGCAWINPDPKAGPLMDSLQPVAGLLDDVGVENHRVLWWKEVILNANWKVVQEAFMEPLHVPQTHSQMVMPGLEQAFLIPPYFEIFPNGHSGFSNPDVVSDFPDLDIAIQGNKVLAEGMDGMVLEQDLRLLERLKTRLKPGENIRAAVARAFRSHYEAADIPMAEGVESRRWWWTANVFLFPNAFLLPMYGNGMAYRSRPYNDDPEWCRFEIWSLTTPPRSEPVKRAALTGRFDKEDEKNWPLVFRQDFSNIERQQRGLHSVRHDSQRLSHIWERDISHMHLELDRRLAQR